MKEIRCALIILKCSIIFLLYLSLIDMSYSQKILDTIFEDVIQITHDNVATTSSNYLFNTSILKDIKTPIIFIDTNIPLHMLSNIYSEFERLIIITPNWYYYHEVSNIKSPEEVYCAEPMTLVQ